VGIIVGRWHFDDAHWILPEDELSIIAGFAGQLQAATGLRVEHIDTVLWIPELRQELCGWWFDNRTVTVRSLIPAHPYLWENLDMVMTAAGGRRDTAANVWRPDPAHAPLRTRWDALCPRDRFLLALPSVWGARPFDWLVSQIAR
jgi:hypothetical protein